MLTDLVCTSDKYHGRNSKPSLFRFGPDLDDVIKLHARLFDQLACKVILRAWLDTIGEHGQATDHCEVHLLVQGGSQRDCMVARPGTIRKPLR